MKRAAHQTTLDRENSQRETLPSNYSPMKKMIDQPSSFSPDREERKMMNLESTLMDKSSLMLESQDSILQQNS